MSAESVVCDSRAIPLVRHRVFALHNPDGFRLHLEGPKPHLGADGAIALFGATAYIGFNFKLDRPAMATSG
jgi:hypothetical protein